MAATVITRSASVPRPNLVEYLTAHSENGVCRQAWPEVCAATGYAYVTVAKTASRLGIRSSRKPGSQPGCRPLTAAERAERTRRILEMRRSNPDLSAGAITAALGLEEMVVGRALRAAGLATAKAKPPLSLICTTCGVQIQRQGRSLTSYRGYLKRQAAAGKQVRRTLCRECAGRPAPPAAESGMSEDREAASA